MRLVCWCMLRLVAPSPPSKKDRKRDRKKTRKQKGRERERDKINQIVPRGVISQGQNGEKRWSWWERFGRGARARGLRRDAHTLLRGSCQCAHSALHRLSMCQRLQLAPALPRQVECHRADDDRLRALSKVRRCGIAAHTSHDFVLVVKTESFPPRRRKAGQAWFLVRVRETALRNSNVGRSLPLLPAVPWQGGHDLGRLASDL